MEQLIYDWTVRLTVSPEFGGLEALDVKYIRSPLGPKDLDREFLRGLADETARRIQDRLLWRRHLPLRVRWVYHLG
jgi:hypothetical protein